MRREGGRGATERGRRRAIAWRGTAERRRGTAERRRGSAEGGRRTAKQRRGSHGGRHSAHRRRRTAQRRRRTHPATHRGTTHRGTTHRGFHRHRRTAGATRPDGRHRTARARTKRRGTTRGTSARASWPHHRAAGRTTRRRHRTRRTGLGGTTHRARRRHRAGRRATRETGRSSSSWAPAERRRAETPSSARGLWRLRRVVVAAVIDTLRCAHVSVVAGVIAYIVHGAREVTHVDGDHEVTDVDLVTRTNHRRRRDATAVEIGAVGALQVGNEEAPLPAEHLRVTLGDVALRQDDVIPRDAANGDLVLVELHPLGRSPLLRHVQRQHRGNFAPLRSAS